MGAMWDGERVKEEGMELTQMVWEECPAQPLSRLSLQAELGVLAQGAVTWSGGETSGIPWFAGS